MICFAAVAIVISPDEHWRSVDMPGAVTGRPARSAMRRATFIVCEPCCIAAPNRTSSISPPSTPARSTAALTEKAPSVGARVLLNEPRAALVSGVRAVETMTASRMIGVLLSGSGYLNGGGRPVKSRLDEELADPFGDQRGLFLRSEEHTSELQSLMRISYAVFCLK